MAKKSGIELLEELYALPDEVEARRRVAAMTPEERQSIELAHRHKRDQLESAMVEDQESYEAFTACMSVCASYGMGKPGNEALTLGDIMPLMGDEEKRVVIKGMVGCMKTGYRPFQEDGE